MPDAPRPIQTIHRKGRSLYCSNPDTEIFQRKPQFSKPSQFSLKSWTETIEGYQNEAKRLTTCIINNRKLMVEPYQWFVTIYVWQVLPPKEVADLWTKACRSLRRHGITALWVREPTRTNKVHYHLIVSSSTTKAAMAKAIEAAMPCRKQIGWHKRIQPVTKEWRLAYYITKAKLAGNLKGKKVVDKYATKRLLFKPSLNLKKFGTIGKFWIKSKKALWDHVKERELQIADGLQDWRVRQLAIHAHDFIGGYVSLKKIERTFGYYATTPTIQDWIKKAILERSPCVTQVFPSSAIEHKCIKRD